MVRRMAIHAAYIAVCVRRTGEVSLLLLFSMARQAARTRLLAGKCLKTDDFADVAAARNVFRSRSVTGFAPMSAIESGLKVRSMFEAALVEILVTGLADVAADVFGCSCGWQGIVLFLAECS